MHAKDDTSKLGYYEESDHGTKTVQRTIREYMASSRVNGMSVSVYVLTRSVIKSYFGVHDIVLGLPKTRKRRPDPVPNDDSSMTLENFYKMLQNRKPSIMMKTIMPIKLQSDMDSSTFTDRFNYYGCTQIVRCFKTDDYTLGNIDRCPMPIKLLHVKTNMVYTAFLNRDAIIYHMWYDPGIQMVSEMNLPRPSGQVVQTNRLPLKTANAWRTSAWICTRRRFRYP